ncbi:MAG: ATP-binding protein, partial [Chloroflexi bacterium]|nr:ATP-binding protein [Chloroflexota bacterium]
ALDDDAIRDIRNFILDLRPQRFEGDLGKGIARLVREFQANALVPVEVRLSPEAVARLPVRVAQTLFLSTQEALANIARHARATQVTLEVLRENGLVRLTVSDNGRGFDLSRQNMSLGHGLANMRTRAEELQGAFNLQSRPGQAAVFTLTLPNVAAGWISIMEQLKGPLASFASGCLAPAEAIVRAAREILSGAPGPCLAGGAHGTSLRRR